MIRFPNLGYAKFPSASFLNNLDSFSFAAWVRFASITLTGQYLFRHAGTSNQISFRVRETTGIWYLSTTVGGVLVTRTGGTPAANTLYHVVGTWKKNDAAGLALIVDGSLVGTASTTGQTANYDAQDDAAPLFLGAKKDDSNKGNIDIENFIFIPGYVLTLGEAQALRQCGWYRLLAVPRPAVAYLLDGKLLTEIPDISGNGRHIASANIFGSVTDQGMRGRWERETHGSLLLRSAMGAAAPAGPGPWIDFGPPPEVLHPVTTVVVTGLTDDVPYQFAVTALDNATPTPNESALSAIASATPRAVSVKHVERKVFLGHK